MGQLLDEKFQVVYNLTYNTIAMHCGVDTSMLRRAIWNYVHCVFGIRWVPKEPLDTHPKTPPSVDEADKTLCQGAPKTSPTPKPLPARMRLTKPCANRGRGFGEGPGCADLGAVG